jgi:hypothetical protein
MPGPNFFAFRRVTAEVRQNLSGYRDRGHRQGSPHASWDGCAIAFARGGRVLVDLRLGETGVAGAADRAQKEASGEHDERDPKQVRAEQMKHLQRYWRQQR